MSDATCLQAFLDINTVRKTSHLCIIMAAPGQGVKTVQLLTQATPTLMYHKLYISRYLGGSSAVQPLAQP